MSTAASSGNTRYDFLDWLRVLAIFVLFFYHTGMIFVGWGWHVRNAEVIESLRLPMEIAHRLRMPLLFVVAGAGLWFALGRRTGLGVLRERSLRLLLPLVAGMFLVVPPQIWYERLFRGQWEGGYSAFYVERVLQLQPYPLGDFSWHHLWFIAYLYVYVLLLLPVLVVWRRKAAAVQPGAWLYGLAAPLALNELWLKPIFPVTNNLVADWYNFIHYFLLTLCGFLLASIPGAWDWLASRRRVVGTVALVVFGAALAAYEVFGLIDGGTPADAVVANIFVWCSLLAFLAYGRHLLSFSNGLLRWARDASYPLYIVHQTMIVAIGYYVIELPWSPWAKFWAVLGASLAASVVLYELAIRRFGVMRLLFGLKSGTPIRQPYLEQGAYRG